MTTQNQHPNWLIRSALKILGITQAFFEQVLAPSISVGIQSLLPQLAPIALAAVTAAAEGGKSGSAAQKAASKQVQDAAISAGIQASSSAINLAIEFAVQQLKSQPTTIAQSAPIVAYSGEPAGSTKTDA